jgi:hypothetical protein
MLTMLTVDAGSVVRRHHLSYTNADIAFSSSLIEVLGAVANAISRGILSKRVLLVGKRLNIFNVGDGSILLPP